MHLYASISGFLVSFLTWESSQILSELPGAPQVPENPYRQAPISSQTPFSQHRPVVIWHGLGDNYNGSGIHRATELFDSLYPGIYVYSIYLDKDPSSDQNKSLFGDANDEVDIVCEQLSSNSYLKDGFDAIGFSQGGVFLRALIQRCDAINVHNLITFGSPHMGVMELPLCKSDKDWVCKRRNQLLKSQVWNDSVQKRIIPAQYFRDPYQYDKYIQHSHFLADINNELADSFNESYVRNLASINMFVLVTFSKDTTVIPKDSAAFQDIDTETGQALPFEETIIYTRNLIGLKELKEADKLRFHAIAEDHMVISNTELTDIATQYLGGFI